MGNGSILRPGEFQRMSAGTGVRHSEFNPSATEPAHFYQIWLLPQTGGIEPSYEQKFFAEEEKLGRLKLVASPDSTGDSLSIHQDAKVYLAKLNPGESVSYDISPGRHAWLQVLTGGVNAGGAALQAGDGLSASAERRLVIVGGPMAEVMLFDLA